MQPGRHDWFWREIVQINLNRGLRYAMILAIVNVVMVVVDVIRLVRGVIPGNPGYQALFVAHLVILGFLGIYLLVYYFARPVETDAIGAGHGVLAVTLALAYLAFCTAVALIDQNIDGQITVYVIGCMTLAVALYMPLRVSIPLFTINHAIFVVGLVLLQSDQVTLTNHLVNATIVMALAVIITKMMFDAKRRVFQGMSIIQSQQTKLERLAIEDSLTGLYNRRYADSRMAEEFERSRRYERPFSLAMADIDHFKEINDSHSHQIGDEVLRRLSGLLRAEIRAVDMVARYGGEEFVIVFPETPEARATAVCEKMRVSIEQHDWEAVASGLSVTISIGVSGSTEPDDLAGIMRVADDRLYQAKRAGRNRVTRGS